MKNQSISLEKLSGMVARKFKYTKKCQFAVFWRTVSFVTWDCHATYIAVILFGRVVISSI